MLALVLFLVGRNRIQILPLKLNVLEVMKVMLKRGKEIKSRTHLGIVFSDRIVQRPRPAPDVRKSVVDTRGLRLASWVKPGVPAT